jgi:hypothetical protein
LPPPSAISRTTRSMMWFLAIRSFRCSPTFNLKGKHK